MRQAETKDRIKRARGQEGIEMIDGLHIHMGDNIASTMAVATSTSIRDQFSNPVVRDCVFTTPYAYERWQLLWGRSISF